MSVLCLSKVGRGAVVFVGALCLASVQARGHVELDAPNGGEVLPVGSIFTIEWHIVIAHNQLNWDLWYSTTGPGGPWMLIAEDLPPGSQQAGSIHTYDWTVPDDPSDQVRVRVRMDNSGTDYYDESDADLTIESGPPQTPAEISLVPVNATGPHTIVGNQITLNGIQQRVFLEIRLANWDPDQNGSPLLKLYQAVIDSSGFTSAQEGTLARPIVPCTNDVTCESTLGNGSTCAAPFPDECLHGFIDSSRTDYVFFGLDDLSFVALDTLDYRFGSLVQSGPFASDPDAPTYAGTLVMDVSYIANGTFTVGFQEELGESYMLDENDNAIPLTFTPARITVDGPDIPAVSEWGIIVMTLLVICAGTILLGRPGARGRGLKESGLPEGGLG